MYYTFTNRTFLNKNLKDCCVNFITPILLVIMMLDFKNYFPYQSYFIQ